MTSSIRRPRIALALIAEHPAALDGLKQLSSGQKRPEKRAGPVRGLLSLYRATECSGYAQPTMMPLPDHVIPMHWPILRAFCAVRRQTIACHLTYWPKMGTQ